DRERESKVALKTLRTLEADAWQRFKNEFRSLQHIQHPNLVSLGELLEESGVIFFTMELISGTDFFHYVRPRETLDTPSDPAAALAMASKAPSVRLAALPPPPLASPAEHGALGASYGDVIAGKPDASRALSQSSLPKLKAPGRGFHEARLRAALKQLARGIF